MIGTGTLMGHLCPRPYCGGAVLASTGTCILCGRSTDPPIEAATIPRENVGFHTVVVQRPATTPQERSTRSFNCRSFNHRQCGGNRYDDGALLPCECSCHTAPAPASLPRWVRLRKAGSNVRGHLLESEERRGDPPLHWAVACGRWFPVLDVQDAPEGWHRCRGCERATVDTIRFKEI